MSCHGGQNLLEHALLVGNHLLMLLLELLAGNPIKSHKNKLVSQINMRMRIHNCCLIVEKVIINTSVGFEPEHARAPSTNNRA